MKTAKCTLIRLYESRNMIETRADQDDLPLTNRGGGGHLKDPSSSIATNG